MRMGSSSWLDFNVFALTLPLSLAFCDLLRLVELPDCSDKCADVAIVYLQPF